jgi:hypothetical protein
MEGQNCPSIQQIKQAEQDGYTELADRLRKNLAKEVRYIEENYGNSQ